MIESPSQCEQSANIDMTRIQTETTTEIEMDAERHTGLISVGTVTGANTDREIWI
jgi:hypothetical protein